MAVVTQQKRACSFGWKAPSTRGKVTAVEKHLLCVVQHQSMKQSIRVLSFNSELNLCTILLTPEISLIKNWPLKRGINFVVWKQLLLPSLILKGLCYVYITLVHLHWCMTELHCFFLTFSSAKESCLTLQHNSSLYWFPYRLNSRPLYSYLINETLWFVCQCMSESNDYKSIMMFRIQIWEEKGFREVWNNAPLSFYFEGYAKEKASFLNKPKHRGTFFGM